ncbi:nuclear transport factor 2 family protein [Serratia sp. L9]|uniref:nuclear transport factor 2 family protein n=1 Tax=Serratia sp. L9 TaxID=3423946 RepID=UPI003D673F2C
MTACPSCDVVQTALQQVVGNPKHQPLLISELFSRDYCQKVDGNTLNFEQFLQHMALLKQITHSMTLEILAIVAEGDAVLTHHLVNVEKHDGSQSQIRVLAHFTVRNGKIQSCVELTQLLVGQHEDRDLGSRQ